MPEDPVEKPWSPELLDCARKMWALFGISIGAFEGEELKAAIAFVEKDH